MHRCNEVRVGVVYGMNRAAAQRDRRNNALRYRSHRHVGRGRLRVDILLPRAAASLVYASFANASRPAPVVLRSRGALGKPRRAARRLSRSGAVPRRWRGSWRLCWPGVVAGLAFGQLHVWWRHTTELGWRTPSGLRRLLRRFAIVLPEDHDGHHRNPDIEFGDIFRFYDAPARALIAWLAPTSRRARHAGRRAARRLPARA